MATVRARVLICISAGLLALTAGCGSSAVGGDYGGQHPDYGKALAGSPPTLAALHKQANELLPGGKEAVEQRLSDLHGYPVVVNFWASWCHPCREEFPSFQKLSAKYGKRVAFLGVNSEDADDAAETFLTEAPVSYPSYADPDKDVLDSLDALGGLPDTAYYDRSGERCFLHQGQYFNQGEIDADIRAYAIGGAGECESG